MHLSIELTTGIALLLAAQQAAAGAGPPWLLILLAAAVIVAAALAGWLTWRDAKLRAVRSPEAAPAGMMSATNAAAQVGAPRQPAPTLMPASPGGPGRYQLSGVSGALAGSTIPVDDECLISRGPVRWAVIPDSTISAPHAALDLTREPPRVKDLGSRNGTRLDQAALGASFVNLAAGQPIDLGSLSLSLEGGTLRVTRGAQQGKTFALTQSFVVLSRREMPVHVAGDADPGLSDAHALLTVNGGQLTIKDLNSSNGTLVNQARIEPAEATPLQPGDVIQFGRSTFKVQTNR